MRQMKMIKPRALERGDTVAIVYPCSRPFHPGMVAEARRKLEEAGFRATVGAHSLEHYGDFAGPDPSRLEDFHGAWADPRVKAILCNGGNGAIRLLPQLDYDLIRANPKIFMGMSDVTGLHLAIHRMTGLVTLHGPSAQNYDATLYTHTNALRALTSRLPLGEIHHPIQEAPYSPPYPPYSVVVREGRARGRLIGGNLTLICQTMGTPYEIETEGRILFLEDVGEEPHVLDSMLTQLALAGKLRAAAGIIVGEHEACEPRGTFPLNFSVEDLIEQHMGALGIPVVYGFRFGHTADKCVLPLGVEATLEAVGSEARVVIEEAACL